MYIADETKTLILMEKEFKYEAEIEVTTGDGSEDSVEGYWVEGYEICGKDAILYESDEVAIGDDDYVVRSVYPQINTIESFICDYLRENGLPEGMSLGEIRGLM